MQQMTLVDDISRCILETLKGLIAVCFVFFNIGKLADSPRPCITRRFHTDDE